MGSAPSLQAGSIIGTINASELNSPTLQVQLAPAIIRLSAREQPAAKHFRVIGAPRIIMLVEIDSQCDWNGLPPTMLEEP